MTFKFKKFVTPKQNLPIIMNQIKDFLIKSKLNLCDSNTDGRVNSSSDEHIVINKLIEKFGDKVKKSENRMWHDITVKDDTYGWVPVNIKTTTTNTADNVGNFAICVYAYTNEPMDLDEKYSNGIMSDVLLKKLQKREYNITSRDYYFLVINKNDTSEIIVNSMKGLKVLTPNINNLPFQICWKNNKIHENKSIENCVNMFVKCVKAPAPSWKEKFLTGIRKIPNI